MPDREGNRNRGGSRWNRLSKTLAFWLLVFLIPVMAIQLMAPRDQGMAEFSYSELMRHITNDNVASVTFVDARQLEGRLRTPITVENRTVERFRTQLVEGVNEKLVTELEARGVEIRVAEPRQNWWGLVISIFPWLLIIGFWLFLIRQMQAGGNKAFQFGKSKARLLTADTPKVTFADVAGADEAKEELQEIIEFLKDPQKFSRLGGRLPKGALLVGPPGTGKTLLAKAVAGEAGRPFFSVSGSDFVEMFVGVGASRVRDLFEQGKAHAPCIIFIDEIDAVGRHRGAGMGGGHDEREQTLNQLLVEMDGFESNDGVILIAATNRPDVLDPALLRPGRLDRRVVVPHPDVLGREKILDVHVRRLQGGPDIDTSVIARGTPGFSGADLENLVNEAALIAARHNKDRVTMADSEFAKDKVIMGTERRSAIISEEDRKVTAYHEAGHALVAALTPQGRDVDPVHKVTIIPRGRALGVMMQLPLEDHLNATKEWAINRITIAMGGRAAEELIFDQITSGASQDLQQATDMARRMICEWGMSPVLGPVNYGGNGSD